MRDATTVSVNRPSRRALLGAVVASAMAGAARAACAPPRVLFVCPYGTVKSAIARERLKQRAAAIGLAVRARSRGLDVQNHVSPKLAAALTADGLDPAAEPAQKLGESDLEAGQIVVAFDEAAKDPRLRGARVWDVPSWNDDYAAARAALDVHISKLLDELQQQKPPACSRIGR